MNKSVRFTTVVGLLFALAAGTSGMATTVIWTGGDGAIDWTDAAKWGGTAPVDDDTAQMEVGSGAAAWDFSTGDPSPADAPGNITNALGAQLVANSPISGDLTNLVADSTYYCIFYAINSGNEAFDGSELNQVFETAIAESPTINQTTIEDAGSHLDIGEFIRTSDRDGEPDANQIKELDADGDNIHGTDGYVFYGSSKMRPTSATSTICKATRGDHSRPTWRRSATVSSNPHAAC